MALDGRCYFETGRQWRQKTISVICGVLPEIERKLSMRKESIVAAACVKNGPGERACGQMWVARFVHRALCSLRKLNISSRDSSGMASYHERPTMPAPIINRCLKFASLFRIMSASLSVINTSAYRSVEAKCPRRRA